MSDNSKPNIPKFASFRPKATPSAKNTTSSERDKVPKETQHEERRHHRRRSRSVERQHKHRDRRERSRERDRQRREKIDAPQQIVKARASEPVFATNDGGDLFTIDRNGDMGNLTYGRLHKYSIPVYQRVGHGSVLGLNLRLKIDRELSTEKEIVVGEPGRSERHSRRLLAKPSSKASHRVRLIRPTGVDQMLDHDEDFVLLQPNKKRMRGSQSPVSEHGEQDYRSIEGKAKRPTQPDDADLEYFTDSSGGGAMGNEAEATARKRNGELTRMSNEKPHELSVWLELIEHQAALFGGTDFAIHTLSTVELRNLADIRISIYEKALQNIGVDVDARAIFWVGLLKEGGLIWESKKLASKWQEALQAHPSALKLWIAYLDFIQTSATEFRYERCKSEYASCLDILAGAREAGLKHNKLEQHHISKIFIYLLLRITVFMRESGYHEHSEAVWQAALETRFLPPKHLHSEHTAESDLLSSLEEFWESEVPRIGGVDSKGWSQFSTDNEDYQDPVVTELESIGNAEDVFKSFAVAEKIMAGKLSHPGRSADEAGEDDPYHIIFFNDIKPFLLPQLLRMVPQTSLIHAFLCYAGLPGLAWASDRNHEGWWLDSFLRWNSAKVDSGFHSLKHSAITPDILFSDAFEDIKLQDAAWTRRVLRSICDASNNEFLAEYVVAFELHYFPERLVILSLLISISTV
jgi:hypothetical protein